MKKKYIKVSLLIGILMLVLGVFLNMPIGGKNGAKNNLAYQNKVMEKDSAARREAKEIIDEVADKGKLSPKAYKKVVDTVDRIYSIAGKDGELSQKDKIDLSYSVALTFYVNDSMSEYKSKSADAKRFSNNKICKAIKNLHNFLADSNENSIKKEKIIKILGNAGDKPVPPSNVFKGYIDFFKKV
ncbi:MAG: hypothetical protein SOR72_06180 [Hornefia sp.]|nr:hypothetical protein [Hornefia sp.]